MPDDLQNAMDAVKEDIDDTTPYLEDWLVECWQTMKHEDETDDEYKERVKQQYAILA